MTYHELYKGPRPLEGEAERAPTLPVIELQSLNPRDILWKWCETEELLGTRGSVFPRKFSSAEAEGLLDTRLHDWAQRQIVAHQRENRLRGVNLFRLVRKKIWRDAGEFRFCDSPAEQQAFDKALRLLGHCRDSLMDLIYERLCAYLTQCAERDRTL